MEAPNLDEREFRALLTLLDDSDPEVLEHVEQKLLTLGPPVIERLESAWETMPDEALQRRIEEVIGRIQLGHSTDELYKWRLDGGRKLFDGWVTLSRFQYPTLNVAKYQKEISRLVNKIWLELTGSMNVFEKLCIINRQLYTYDGYTGNFREPDKPENVYLNTLIDHKTGNSLSLSALYSLICTELEIPTQVVNFQGYFALRCYDRNSNFYIDAYNRGIIFSPPQVQQFLQKLKADQELNHYKPLSNIYIVLNMIQVLIQTYKKNGRAEKAQTYTDLLQAIEVKLG